MKKLLYLLFALVMLLFCCAGCGGDGSDVVDQVANIVQAEDEHVLGVKGGTNSNYPNTTYGVAFENFFSSPTWKYFRGTKESSDEDGDGKPDTTEENVDIVEFTGYCTYMDVEVKALLQFTLDKSGETFEATYLSFNDVPQNNLILWALLDAAFKSEEEPSSTETDIESDVSEVQRALNAPGGGANDAVASDNYYAVDFVGKEPGSIKNVDFVVSKLGNDFELAPVDGGGHLFYYENGPDMYFMFVPDDWSDAQITGTETIEAVLLGPNGWANEYVCGNMTCSQLDNAIALMDGVISAGGEGYYSEMDGDTYCYTIETQTATILFEWYGVTTPQEREADAVSVIPKFSENAYHSEYFGSWGDSWSQRCYIDIEYRSGLYYIDINWSSSASENTHWSFVGWYDEELGGIAYDNGICQNELYSDNGQVSESVLYSNGTGLIYLSDNYLYWNDYTENAGSECVFELMP